MRWYVVRIERFLRAHPGREPDELGPDDVEAYLRAAGRSAQAPGWMFRQLAHALQIFWCYVIGAGWAQDFQWDYWLSSAVDLETDHPTVARHNLPIHTGEGLLRPWVVVLQATPVIRRFGMIASIFTLI